MKIGMFVRADWRVKPGGDLVQASEYCRSLNSRGVDAALIDTPKDARRCDIVHVFNLDRPWDSLPIAREAMKSNARVVLSPLLHPRQSVLRYQASLSFPAERLLIRMGLTGDATERLKAMARGFTAKRSSVLHCALRVNAADCKRRLWGVTSGIALLSKAEGEELRGHGYLQGERRSAVIRNGVTLSRAGEFPQSPDLAAFVTKYPRFALVGGRIEPRKNQLSIADAAEDLGIPVIFAGELNQRHRRYCGMFTRRVRTSSMLFYIGGVTRQAFAALLERCWMHVSASLFEVSPLVDLEARAVGRWIVATNQSLGVEFLDDCAAICDPWSGASIKEAMHTQWDMSRLATVMKVPSWDDTGEPLIDLYDRVLSNDTAVHFN